MYKKYLLWIFLFLPIFSYAQINLNEIMFDPEGSDTDREWIEIINTDGATVDLEKYKVCEKSTSSGSESCHKLYDGFGNNFKIPAHSFGIIAKKPEKFKEDYPDFSGFILKAAISLVNSSKLVELKNSNGVVISQVEYNSEVGGKNGNTFSLIGEIWKNGKATPAAENIFQEVDSGGNNSSSTGGGSTGKEDNQKIQRTYVEITDVIDGKKKLKAEIIGDIPALIAGAENEFHGRAYGITGIEIKGAEYFWYFGDGEKEYGKNVKHTYLYPGEYVLTLIVKSSSFTGNVRRIVKVINPSLEILAVDSEKNWIKIKNNYSEILKLDSWKIFVDGDQFLIPKETYILGKSEVIFPNKITHLDIKEDSHIFLLFPNGEKATKFIKKTEEQVLKAVQNNINLQTVNKNIVVKKESVENQSKKNIIKKTQEKIKELFIKKKPVLISKTEKEAKIYNSEFAERNFVEIEKEKKDNFAKQNSPQNKTPQSQNFQKIKNLKIPEERNFWLENIYFIIFIILTGGLVVISFLLNYFENKNNENYELELEAEEFEIEEI